MRTSLKTKSTLDFSPAQTKSVVLTEHVNLSSSQVFVSHTSLTLSHPDIANHQKIFSTISASTKEHDPTRFVGFSSILPPMFLFQVMTMWSIISYKGYQTHSTQFLSDTLNSCVQTCRLTRGCTQGMTQLPHS